MKPEWLSAIDTSLQELGFSFDAPAGPDAGLSADIHALAAGVPEFAKADLRPIESFSLFRTLLYVLVRKLRPALVIETGILNGFSSAFILQAMEDNGVGKLISIDLPHNEGEYEEQGTTLLPRGKAPGWAIPQRLHHRHAMHFGKAEELLPRLIDNEGAPDIFIHDSDHRYPHMMMEIAFAWSRMEKGLIVADNVEQNRAFLDFAAGVAARHTIVSSYSSAERTWQHGVMRK